MHELGQKVFDLRRLRLVIETGNTQRLCSADLVNAHNDPVPLLRLRPEVQRKQADGNRQ